MAKFSKDLDEGLVKKVENFSSLMGFDHVMEIKPIALLKTKKEVGVIVRGGELTGIFTGRPDIVAVALYEPAFLRVDEETQNMWIESLMSQISFDYEKDKISINKPEINIPIGIYRKYGNVATQKAELALMTIEQIAQEEEEIKQAQKESKKNKKKK